MEQIRKTYTADLSVDEGKREVVAVISTDAVDRDGEVVSPKGMKRKNFSGNPVVFYGHDYASLPIGKSLWVKATDGAIIAKSYISDKTQFARDVFGLMQDGVLRAFSVGFQSIRKSKPSTAEMNARPDLKGASLIHREWELMEYSVVSVPANPEALTLAVSKGIAPETLKVLQWEVEKQAAAQVIGEVVVQIRGEVIDPNDAAEIRKRILKSAERINMNVDIARVVEQAFARLSGVDGK